jgi:hypothetical protein
VNFNPNWPLPDDYLLELGRMVSVWGSLESTTALAIARLAGYDSPTDPRALTMVAHSNFQQRVDMALSTCRMARMRKHITYVLLTYAARRSSIAFPVTASHASKACLRACRFCCAFVLYRQCINRLLT